jgi:flagellar assembly protein FliH
MMTAEELPPENVSTLIDHVLKAKDPATVGLKRILKKKQEEKKDFPLRGMSLEEFSVPGKESKKLTVDEQHILELEKKAADLQVELRKQKEQAMQAIQAAYAKGKKEGDDAGHVRGVSEATETYEKKINELQQGISSVLKGIETAKRTVFSNAEHMVLKLCCAMVKRIISREVSIQKDIVLDSIKRALEFIGHREKIIVRVAKNDLELVSGRKDFWFPVGERLEDMTIEADERIEPGGCIIESNSGVVDARLGVQYNELTDLVEKVWADVASAAADSKAGKK